MKLRFLSLLSSSCTLAAVAALCVSRVAATPAPSIEWGTPQLISGAADVVDTGVYFDAVTAVAADVTVNGVLFRALPSSGNLTVSSAGKAGLFGTFSSGDDGYDDMVNSSFFTAGDGSTETLTIANLTVGHAYLVQLFTPSWDRDWPTQFSVGSDVVEMGNTATEPTYVIGTFLALDSTLVIEYKSTIGAHGMLAAASVRDLSAVPEVSTFGMLAGLAGLAAAVHRRRARR